MMVQRFVIFFLVLMVVFVGFGCSKDESAKEDIDDELTKLLVAMKPFVSSDPEGKRITWKKDRAKMVLVKPYIPAQYGEKATFDRLGNPITKKVKVLDASPSLWMDATEVTVGQFKKFLSESNHPFDGDRWARIYKYSPTNKHPMIHVSWLDATAYAKWAGKRLPTEKEWEFAARGGLVDKMFSWGDDEAVVREYANFEGTDGKDQWNDTTALVGSFKPNGYGIYDMSGNVWEWCQDWYDEGKEYRVCRGGSWSNSMLSQRVAYRVNDVPTAANYYVGFRCVLESK